jgi:hypothetical protein
VDAHHFDHVVSALTEPGSRRKLLRLMAGLPLAGAFIALWDNEMTDAHGRRKRRVRRHRHGKGRRRRDRQRTKRNRRRTERRSPDCTPGACPPPANPCQEAACQDNTCTVRSRPDNTACNGDGRCLNGVCNQPPICEPAGTTGCITKSPPCCGECNTQVPSGMCEPGEAGRPCLEDSDCTSNSCVGYVCQG